MTVGEGGFRIDDAGEGLAHGVDVEGGKLRLPFRVETKDRGSSLLDGIVGQAILPEPARLIERHGCGGKIGIKPAARTLDQRIYGDLGASRHAEGVEMLRNAHQPGDDGNVRSFEAARIAASVPMFVEITDADSDSIAKTEFANDDGSAVAPELDQIAIVGVLGGSDFGDARAFLKNGSAGQNLLPEHFYGRELGPERPRPVRELGASFDCPVVSTNNLTHAGGVVTTAHIFEKAGVIEVGDKVLLQTGRHGQTNSQQTRTDCMARDRSLSQVEGEWQRDQNLLERRLVGFDLIVVRRGGEWHDLTNNHVSTASLCIPRW